MTRVYSTSAHFMASAALLNMVTLCVSVSWIVQSSMIQYVGQTERTTQVNVF